jgi:hypothetical protein
MSFEEFQNRARLHVIGALYPDEIAEFEDATLRYGSKARDFIRDCYALRDAFALSLRPQAARSELKEKLTSMIRRRQAL